jgi:Transmembrane domain of unknown function (DUF3566)
VSTPEHAYGAGTRSFTAGGQTSTAPSTGQTSTSQTSTGQPSTAQTSTGQPAPAPQQARAQGATAHHTGPRKVRLTLSRVDAWSVAKMGFLISVAVGIAFVVMIAVLWMILDGMGVFSDIDRTVRTVLGETGSSFDLMQYVGFSRVVSLATVIGVVDVFLLTALSTLGAFLYNICSALVGGLQLTLTDD